MLGVNEIHNSHLCKPVGAQYFAIHDYKGLHKYLVLSKQRFGAITPGVMSWARDQH